MVGVALLAWIVQRALKEGHWDRLADAPPAALALLLGCTVASAVLNGSIFWITVRPLKPLGWWDLQRLNLVANMLNYAPVRLGALARVLYHMRVDRLRLVEVGAWFAIVGYVLVLGVGACGVATLARPRLDWAWALLVVAQLVAGAVVLRMCSRIPLAASLGAGVDRLAGDNAAIGGALLLRLADVAAYTGRMAAAAWILEVRLSGSDTVLLALVALLGSLIPLGRVGFREFCVLLAAQRLSIAAGDVDKATAQLALVESAGEAAVFVPLGAIWLWWFRSRWRAAGKKGFNTEGTEATVESTENRSN